MSWETRLCPICRRTVTYDLPEGMFRQHRTGKGKTWPWCPNSNEDILVSDTHRVQTNSGQSVRAVRGGLPTLGRR